MTKPTGKPVGRPRKDAVQARDDGPYMNVISSLGSSRDSGGYTKASPVRYFSEIELTDLYIGDGFARRIVDVTATDMTRAGFCIEVEGDDESEEESAYAPVMVRLEELHTSERLTDALKLEAIFGGSMIVMGVKDGGDLTEPLNDRAVQDIEFLRVYDRYHVSRMEKYTDPADIRYGQTQTYLVSPSNATPYTVHESRCIVFAGEFVPESMRDLQDGWGVSALAKCWYQLQRLGVSHQWAEKLLEKSQQAVAKFSGLSQQLMAPGGQQTVINRLNMLDMSRNAINSIAIDSLDDYTITSNSFSGLPDLLDRFAQALSAVTGMPKTLLMGEQAKGLNNSQSGDLQNWYANIEQKQRTHLLQPIDRLVTLLSTAKKIQNQQYLIEFKGLDIPDEKTEAETEKLEAEAKKIKADTAAVYVAAGALDPSELRQTLIKDGYYAMDDVSLETDLPEDELYSNEPSPELIAAPTDKELAEIDYIKAKTEAIRKPAPVVKQDAMPFIIQPNIEIKTPDVNVRFDMPDIKIPEIKVNVEAAKIEAPQVTVNVPKQDAAIVNITNDIQPAAVEIKLPKRETITTITRDEEGEMTGSKSIEKDTE